jgi:hypothetical protein
MSFSKGKKERGVFATGKGVFTQGEEGIEPWAWLLEDSPECEILHAPHLYYGSLLGMDQIR